MSNKRIKSPKSEGKKIKRPSSSDIEIDYPIFCFKYLNINFKGDHKFYFDFIDRLNKLSNLSWNQINTSQRHGFGTEKMPVNQIKPDLPKFITPEVKDLLVFRANGDNRPFLGLRKNNIFHIVFIEENFGDVYNH
ncbi:MAG: hypothetical protein JKX79_01680 [Labilibaculum sp.]|nr:hypothetical protein [Labilibaculum sp.]